MKKTMKRLKKNCSLMIRKASVMTLVMSLVFSAVPVFDLSKEEVNAAESSTSSTINSILLPIELYDQKGDGLLIQYDLANSTIFKLTMDDVDEWAEAKGQGTYGAGQGLVSSTLGPNGTPVYKKEVVEHVAEIVQQYVESDHEAVIVDAPHAEDESNANKLFDSIVASLQTAYSTTYPEDESEGVHVILGNYEESKQKYSEGTAKLEDIETCMDYAYYVLNNFWTDTDADITKNTDIYDYIQMDKIQGTNQYGFSVNSPIEYNLEDRIMRQDTSTTAETAFFPLDKTTIGEDLAATNTFSSEKELYDYNSQNGAGTVTHNYHFSMKSHSKFVYKKSDNLEFHFAGDDDVYLYINNQLVMDLGGAHESRSEDLLLNDLVESGELDLVDGKVYSFDFFYMERHAWASNISIQSNINFSDGDAVPTIKYKKDGEEVAKGGTVREGDELEVEYTAIGTSEGLYDFYFEDDTLGVKIGKTGTQADLDALPGEADGILPNGIIELGSKAYVKDAITVTVTYNDGTPSQSVSITKADLEDEEKVNEFIAAMGALTVGTNDVITVNGIYRKADKDLSLAVDKQKEVPATLRVTMTAPKQEYSTGTLVATLARYETMEVDTVVVIDEGKWRRISDQYELPVTFQDTELVGSFYFLDAPNTTPKFTGTRAKDMIGDEEGNITIPGYTPYFDEGTTIKVSEPSDTILYKSNYADKGIEITKDADVETAESGLVKIGAQASFEVKYKTTYFILEVTNGTDKTYIPMKITVNPSGVNVVGFQMNTNKAEGSVSEYNPSFRTISKASKVMSVGNDLYRVKRFGTVYALSDNITDPDTGEIQYDQLTVENAEIIKNDPDNYNKDTIGYYEATNQGVYDNWTSGNGDEKYYTYYALTIKHLFYSYASLTEKVAVRAYAIIELADDTEKYVYGSDVYSVTPEDIAKDLYENRRMLNKESHQFLYDNVLNPVKIGSTVINSAGKEKKNRDAIVAAITRASGVTSTEHELYAYANQIYKDLFDYMHNTNTANSTKDEEEGFYNYKNHNGFVTSLSTTDEQVLLDVINAYSKENGYAEEDYTSIAAWIYYQVPKILNNDDYGFYKIIDYDYWNISVEK